MIMQGQTSEEATTIPFFLLGRRNSRRRPYKMSKGALWIHFPYKFRPLSQDNFLFYSPFFQRIRHYGARIKYQGCLFERRIHGFSALRPFPRENCLEVRYKSSSFPLLVCILLHFLNKSVLTERPYLLLNSMMMQVKISSNNELIDLHALTQQFLTINV